MIKESVMKNLSFVILLLAFQFFGTETAYNQTRPDFAWVNTIGSQKNDGEDASAIALDGSGNVIVAGRFSDTAILKPGSPIMSVGEDDVFIAKYDILTGNLLWVKTAGGALDDRAIDVATDQFDNIIVIGFFSGTAIFGRNEPNERSLSTNNSNDIFVAKYNSNGNLLYAEKAGGSDDDSGNGVAIDKGNNILVTGSFQGSATFSQFNLNAEGDSIDIFIAKYDPSLNVLWAKHAGGNGRDSGGDIAVDGFNNVIVTGRITGTAYFGRFDPNPETLMSKGGFDIFIAKYDSSGTLSWARNAGGTKNDRGLGIATDGQNNVIVVGDFNGPATFGNETLVTFSTKRDAFVLKYGSSGNYIWAKKGGGPGTDRAWGVSTDNSDDIFVTGRSTGRVTFGSLPLSTSFGEEDIFIVKYDPSGSAQWAKIAGGTMQDEGQNIVVNPVSGDIFITGIFESKPANFDALPRDSEGGFDIFIARLSTAVPNTPAIDVTPSSWDFSSINVGSSSDKTFVVRNTGSANLNVSSTSIQGRDSSQFSIISGSGAFILAPNDMRNVIVRFSPTLQSDMSAMLRLISNDPNENQKDVALSGKGVAGILESSPPALDFGSVSLGKQLDKILGLQNTGDTSISVASTTIGGTNSAQFSIESGGGAFVLSSNSSRNITIRFSPTSAGIKIAFLSIVYDGPESPFTVSLAAFGLDSKPPDIGMDNADSETDLGTPVTVSVNVTDNESVQEVSLYYREGGLSSFQSVSMTKGGDIYSGTIPIGVVGSRGVEFYIRAVDSGNNDTTTVVKAIRVRLPEKQLSKSHFGGSAQTAYRLISFPLELDNKSASSALLGDLGSVDTLQWRLWDINPSDRNSRDPYREYPAIDSFDRGKAMFLISRESKTLTSGAGKTVDTITPFTIPLATGWNMVASPFNFDIPLIRIGPASLRDGIITYEGRWNTPTALKPWSGYMIKVSKPDTLTINATQSVTIPPSIMTKSSIVPDWFIEIVGRAELAIDDGNIAGVIHDAKLEWDRYERFEPPPIGEYVMVLFPHWDWRRNPDVHRTDFRPSDVDGHVWEFSVFTNIREKLVHLNFENLISVPVDFEVELVDIGLNISQDLRSNNQYTFRSTMNGKKQFQLVVGTSSFVEDSASQFTDVPTTFEIGQNFPNPFNPSTTIRYGLPKAGLVSLTVYNVLGEEIAILIDTQYMEDGYHIVVWDGRDQNGKPVASGLYIYQIQAGQFIQSRKMLFLK